MRNADSQIGSETVRPPGPLDGRLHLIEGRIGRMGAFGRAEIGDDAKAAGRDRKNREHAVLMPVHGDFGFGVRIALEMDVGQDPVALQRGAGKRQPETVAHRGVRAVASGQPFRLERFQLAAGMTQGRRDRACRRREGREFDLAFHRDAEAVEMLFQEPLGFRLRQHQPIRIGARHAGEFDMPDQSAAGDDVGGIDLLSRGDELFGAAGARQ
jgi:hypothetical protein